MTEPLPRFTANPLIHSPLSSLKYTTSTQYHIFRHFETIRVKLDPARRRELPLNKDFIFHPASIQFSLRDSVDLRQISGASSSSSSSSIINNANISRFESEGIPRWPWFVFLSGAMGCLICSSLSHLLACHSKRFNFFFWRLDYAGISLMIVSSFFAPIYYAFSCNPYARFFYLSSISLLGILAIITLLSRSLSAPRFRSFRATLFLSMGFSGVIPALHAFLVHWGHQHIIVALGYELAMAILYASGAAFYVTRIPERWKPGKFDIAGHSHQIFHVFVVLGALAHTLATLVVMDFRRASPTCASASY